MQLGMTIWPCLASFNHRNLYKWTQSDSFLPWNWGDSWDEAQRVERLAQRQERLQFVIESYGFIHQDEKDEYLLYFI
jgi:hypothetical protein